MNTFHIEIANLGPIKSAVFDSAQMNVVCGKNNSGKSIFLHTIYCFLAYWRYKISMRLVRDDEIQMLSKGDATIDYEKYILSLDADINESMPKFIEELPILLAKDIDTSQTKICFRINREYATSVFKSLHYDLNYEISNDAAFKMTKEQGSFRVRYILVNKTGANLDEGVVMSAYKYVVAQVCHVVLPAPVLLTAERAGSIMYGADVLAHGFQISQNSIGQTLPAQRRYPYALIQEIQFYQNVKRGLFETTAVGFGDLEKALVNEFSEKVVCGSFSVEDGKILYAPKSLANSAPIEVDASSTSVKALVGLSYFVKSMRSIASLLMIDEPELNLHPERQRDLIRFLAKLVNIGGVGVAISTHSPIIVRELNTLMALAEHKEKCDTLIKNFGYSAEELLSIDRVSCGVMEDGGISQMNKDLKSGFFVRSFDDSSDYISNVQSAIAERLGV